MPDEREVIQADVYVDFPLPNGKTIRGRPVPYPEARKILAQLFAFDEGKGTYEETVQSAVDRFCELTGITDEVVLTAYPHMTPGDLLGSIQRFFFRPSRLAPKAPGAASTTATSPSTGA